MSNPSSKVAEEVAARARGLNAYLARLEALFGRGELGRPDLHRAYAGALVSFAAYSERSIERLFLGLLMSRFTHSSNDVRPLVDIKSEVVARAVVNGGRNYVDWFPYDQHTKPRADAFLSKGLPFSAIDSADKKALERLLILRNAIAHQSSHAMKQFRRTFTDGKALPPEQLTPAGYLRGQHTSSQTRLAFTLAETVEVFQTLCG